MLNEGVHVDDVDGVILLRPTVSPIIYLQQIGRALSAGSRKTPVIFDLVNNFDSLYCIDSLKKRTGRGICNVSHNLRGRNAFQRSLSDHR